VAARPPKRPRVTAEQRAELLRVLRIGMEFRTSCARAKVSVAAVQADAKLYAEALEAFRLGNARLREQAVELTFDAKSTSAGSRAALLDRILNRRDAELARLEAAVPRSEASATKSTNDTIELIAKVFECQLRNDPLGVLPRYIEAAVSTGKLSVEAVQAAQHLVSLLGDHPPLPYSAEWWAAERAAGRNGSGYVPPARVAPAAPAEPVVEVIPPERLKVLDPEQPLPSDRAPARLPPRRATAVERGDAPWNIFPSW
jgi:hypothetical protein